jgi:beta-glucosidase
MRNNLIAIAICIAFVSTGCAKQESTDEKIDALIAKMTVQEKAGQLNQYSGFEILTGDIDDSKISERNERIKNGLLGSVLNVLGTEDVEQANVMPLSKRDWGFHLFLPLM